MLQFMGLQRFEHHLETEQQVSIEGLGFDKECHRLIQ